ncbi:MAG: hypothetical protein AAGC44_10985 [Planctomycetota bacterium]
MSWSKQSRGPQVGRTRRRGSVYVFVLGVTALLVVFGVSGVLLARSVADRNTLLDDQASATLLAQSHLEIVHARFSGGASWRSAHQHNTWSSQPETLGPGEVTYKFNDNLDGSLSDSTTDPVRLYTRAQVGEAVRVFSIELTCYDGLILVPDRASLRRETDG